MTPTPPMPRGQAGRPPPDGLELELKRYGTVPVQVTVFDWGGYRYSKREERGCRGEAAVKIALKVLTFRCCGILPNMRTTKPTVTFHRPFILNRDVGQLPAGIYVQCPLPTHSRPSRPRSAFDRLRTLVA
jgi:hypothetical protein